MGNEIILGKKGVKWFFNVLITLPYWFLFWSGKVNKPWRQYINSCIPHKCEHDYTKVYETFEYEGKVILNYHSCKHNGCNILDPVDVDREKIEINKNKF